MKVLTKVNMSNKEIVNAQNGSKSFKDMQDGDITITGACIYENDREDRITVVKLLDGTLLAGNSTPIRDTIDIACAMLTEKEFMDGVSAKLTTGTGRRGDYKAIIIN